MTEECPPSIWCVVANVAMERTYGPGGEQKASGTKHFRPGAKVVCIYFYWNGPYTKVVVVGRHRVTNRYMKVVTRPRWLSNWRAELVYSPTVIRKMQQLATEYGCSPQFDGSEASRVEVETIVTNWQGVWQEQPHISTRTSNKHPASDRSSVPAPEVDGSQPHRLES
jgi:hypothetical protein